MPIHLVRVVALQSQSHLGSHQHRQHRRYAGREGIAADRLCRVPELDHQSPALADPPS